MSHLGFVRRSLARVAARSLTDAFPRRLSTCAPHGVSNFPGAKTPFTTTLNIQAPESKRPCYRVMNEQGVMVQPDYKSELDVETVRSMYRTMTTLNIMDQIFYDAQRQGRISFYMTNYGEEAIQIGSASALKPDDIIYAQYREAGVLMYRGFSLDSFANQCFSNAFDLGKGRQMPVHYGSNELNFHTISSPLATQLPQAAGAAYALKLEGNGRIVMCYFGEGAASEGDFHAALNFAATLDCPIIFFCRNNGYAISTPVRDQYRGDGIVSRAEGYGIYSVRVDGNDLFAVHEVTKKAREVALDQSTPVLVEAMSYRSGHHSTSDDSTRYRTHEEIRSWTESNNPITRVRLFLESRGAWDSEQEVQLREEARGAVLKAFNTAEGQRKPALNQLFADVYDQLPAHLVEQDNQLKEHLAKHAEHYHLEEFAESR
eukprot:TRINITY_DN5177_c0_g1_i2.p1 TRINITY_DN5177_c0_g1~~TRINITY_DN5177_c0_g1_i2.p1  ORF type:complete len:444 (-),score=123.56 TRINITY_DN5177_c0_g1_i2:226-1515(-)